MKLSHIAVKNAPIEDKPYKMTDGDGMFLYVHPNGSKYWRLKYRFLGKEKLLALGVYPETSLARAREKRIEARELLAEGKDPGDVKREIKLQKVINAENTFQSVGLEWLEARSPKWTLRYAEYMRKRLEIDLFPKLGNRPIKDISAPELLTVVRIVEARGALELANRAVTYASQIFMYGIATGRAERNPANDIKGALKTHVKKGYTHLKEVDLPEFLQKLEKFEDITLQTKLALKLLILTFVRTSELRGATWDEINFDKAEWRISPERMKMRRGHIVPLSNQALAILKELKLLNGQWQYVFPQEYKPIKPISENTILYALYRMGYKNRTTGHGFRHTASTILNEREFNRDHIERQLAHVEENKIRGSYNMAEYLPQRREMMQWWANYITECENGKKLEFNNKNAVPVRTKI
jgi:integrase